MLLLLLLLSLSSLLVLLVFWISSGKWWCSPSFPQELLWISASSKRWCSPSSTSQSFYGFLPASDDALQEAPPPPPPAPRAFMAFFPASDDAWLSPPRPELEASDDILSKNGLLFKLSPPHPLHSTPLHSLGAVFLRPICVFSASWSEGQRRRGCDREAQTPPWYPHPPTSHWICEHQEFPQSNPAASALRIPWENKDRQGRWRFQYWNICHWHARIRWWGATPEDTCRARDSAWRASSWACCAWRWRNRRRAKKLRNLPWWENTRAGSCCCAQERRRRRHRRAPLREAARTQARRRRKQKLAARVLPSSTLGDWRARHWGRGKEGRRACWRPPRKTFCKLLARLPVPGSCILPASSARAPLSRWAWAWRWKLRNHTVLWSRASHTPYARTRCRGKHPRWAHRVSVSGRAAAFCRHSSRIDASKLRSLVDWNSQMRISWAALDATFLLLLL